MNIILSDLYDAPIDPAQELFTTKPGQACRSCIFQRQRVSVCNAAVAMAERAGLESCDRADVVYVRKDTDARQLSLVPQKV